jgi:hypothetical protein
MIEENQKIVLFSSEMDGTQSLQTPNVSPRILSLTRGKRMTTIVPCIVRASIYASIACFVIHTKHVCVVVSRRATNHKEHTKMTIGGRMRGGSKSEY